jgi:hypothetical protein
LGLEIGFQIEGLTQCREPFAMDSKPYFSLTNLCGPRISQTSPFAQLLWDPFVDTSLT